jgi:plastocyanin
MRLGIQLALSAALVLVAGCGGSSNSGGGMGTCNPGATATIQIKSTGISPTAVCVLPAGSVTFQNSDTKQHQMVSDATCTELDTGIIAAGASAVVTFPNAKTCSFHDAQNPAVTAFDGTVAVTTAPVGGPGY